MFASIVSAEVVRAVAASNILAGCQNSLEPNGNRKTKQASMQAAEQKTLWVRTSLEQCAS